MSQVTIVSDEEKPPESQPQEKHGDQDEQSKLAMAVTFGQMTESNRQLQAEIGSTKSEIASIRMENESLRAQMSETNQRIAALVSTLEAEEEEEEAEEVEKIIPPPIEQPKEEEQPKKKRSALQKFLYG